MILSDIEKKVLILISQEKANKEIAFILNISKRMVEYHVTAIIKKFSVTTRVGAVVFGLQNRIITVEEIESKKEDKEGRI